MLIAALIVAALIALVVIIAATKPDVVRVERATTINAPPEKIFALICNFHEWSKWSPWEKLDPELQRTHSGAAQGQGAIYAWQGNRKVGEGRMEIIECTPPLRAVIKLDFLRPFEAHNTTDFMLTRKGESTEVTWVMFGPANFMSKLMQTFMNMDKMIGKDFEAGLANMKAVAEQ